MSILEQVPSLRVRGGVLAVAIALALSATPVTGPAWGSGVAIPTPCDLPGIGFICDAVGQTAKEVAGATANLIMGGVTSWVTNAAVWVTGKVGALIDTTASPNVQAGWFQGQYGSMLTVAGALALPLLLLALIQAIIRQDVWILMRSAFGYLPLAFILSAAAIVATQLFVSITDDLSRFVATGVGDSSSNLLQSVGDAYTQALGDTSPDAVPLFGIFLGAIILAIGAFVLWLEMIIRDAAIYIALFFLPLTFVAMIWPTTSRWARRLVELLIAVILAKFLIVSIMSLATAAITNTTLAASGGGDVFERMIAGSALLILAAWSPFALLRLIPMMEVAAASISGQRAAIAGAAGSAGIQSPASYMRQTMDRHTRVSASPPSAGSPRATYPAGQSAGGPTSGTAARSQESPAARVDPRSGGSSQQPHRAPQPPAPAPPPAAGTAPSPSPPPDRPRPSQGED
jgi:hypothetical protein